MPTLILKEGKDLPDATIWIKRRGGKVKVITLSAETAELAELLAKAQPDDSALPYIPGWTGRAHKR